MLPQDPVILLSYINTQLRDNYSDLEKLRDGLDIGSDDLQAAIDRLSGIGYSYDADSNQFK